MAALRADYNFINKVLVEIHFEEKEGGNKIFAHCYVKEKDYKTKKEQAWITGDTRKFRFAYRNGAYIRKE